MGVVAMDAAPLGTVGNAMTDSLIDVSGSALLYPQKFDAERDRVFFISLSQAAYRKASFLDDRVLGPDMVGQWKDYADVEQAARAVTDPKPLHFIFHTGHVGSTLLSRLIDEAPCVLGLREPLPLRTLAEMHDEVRSETSGTSDERFAARLETFLKLWRRGFADVSHIVLKATSSSGRLATRLLRTSTDSQAVYLNLRAEPYLATLLAGANAMVDLRGFGAERATRLAKHFGLSPPPLSSLSVGELAATSWLAESLTRAEAKDALGDRVLLLDFDKMLADLEATLGAVVKHFAISVPSGFPTTIANSPVLMRYSKAPEQYAYSSAMRAQLLAQARREHAAELRKGLHYIERLARQDARVAALL